jgi:poly(hydroxyalkanoate) granule-associated protein
MATRARKKQARGARIAIAATAAQDQLLDTVHQVWLAGLGALAKAQSGAPKLFNELVREGARVHATASKGADKAMRTLITGARPAIEARVGNVHEKASDTFEHLEKMFQARVQRVLHQLGVPGTRELERLATRVETLNANVEKLARRRATARRAGAEVKRATTPPTTAAH